MDGTNVTDELLNDHCLSNTCAAVGTNFATFHKRRDQVEDFDSSLQDINGLVLVVERRWVSVDRPLSS